MQATALVLVLGIVLAAPAAELESRVLTHYVPQDMLETAVRKEAWTEVPLKVKGGVRKGDVVRIWAGGSIDRGNGDGPGQNVAGPDGVADDGTGQRLALSSEASHAYAVLFKTEGPALHKSRPAGKPLEIKLTRDGEKLWLGFNDQRGRYQDNHLGKGLRHEFDPLWVRIEVVRIIVD
ncbi:MAG: hypothetical protein HYS12_08800 [Planctomycetes bacterium]|nr:hypothetical protein [Planctomycetota bacterium]